MIFKKKNLIIVVLCCGVLRNMLQLFFVYFCYVLFRFSQPRWKLPIESKNLSFTKEKYYKIFLYSDKTLKSKRVGTINERLNIYLSSVFIFFYIQSLGFNSLLLLLLSLSLSLTHTHIHIYMCIYICVCVCERERERERESQVWSNGK